MVTVRPEFDRAGLVEVEWENNRVANNFGTGVRIADLEPLSRRPAASRPWLRGMGTSSMGDPCHLARPFLGDTDTSELAAAIETGPNGKELKFNGLKRAGPGQGKHVKRVSGPARSYV